MVNEQVTTVTLTADTPQEVKFSAAYPYLWIDNKSANDVYAAIGGTPEADRDGTYTIAAGSQLRISGGAYGNGVTLLGEGKVQVVASGIAACPFKSAPAVSGGGGTADAVDSVLNINSENPVQNKVIKAALDNKANSKHTHNAADITDFPDIPNEETVQEWGFTKNSGNYSKPDNGIPKSDLSSDVQESLSKANTALQSHQSLAGYVQITDSRLSDARPANGGNAATVNGHTVSADVPANAKFTDTTYDLATQNTDGLLSKEDKTKLDGLSDDSSASSYYIQSGTVTITTAIRGGASIIFPKEFKSTPLLALTAPFNMISGSNSPVPVVLGYGDLSAAGFTLYPFGFMSTGEKYSANAMVGTARWFALGKI